MEKKIKTLRVVLLIGTIILFIGGLSFLFVSSINPWIRALTMLLITGVLLFLSLYEEFIFKFKGDSITSYVFANISACISFLCIAAYRLFGEWFSLAGDGVYIYLASFMALIALLLLIAAVKYKVYKLIELTIWFILIAIAFVLKHFEIDEIYILGGLITVTLIKNIIKLTQFSKWVTFALLFFSLLYFKNDNNIMACIIALLTLANTLVLLYKSKASQIVFVLFLPIPLVVLSHTCFEPFVGLLIASAIDLLLIGTKATKLEDNNGAYPFLKITYQLTYLFIIVLSKLTGPYVYIVPSVVLATALIEVLAFKDEGEKWILSTKLFYFLYAIVYNLPFSFMDSYFALFVGNIGVLLIYLLSNNKSYRITSIILLFLINTVGAFIFPENLVAQIMMIIMFAIDFYVLYVKDEKLKILFTIAFILYGIIKLPILYVSCQEALIAAAAMYGLFICITIKNKALFASSLFGFLISVSLYLKYVGLSEPYLSLVANTLAYIALVVYQFICVDTEKGKSTFLGVTNGIHIVIMLFWPHNVLLKVFALVEAIVLIVFSMKNDEHKGLFDVGLVGVIASLLFILGTFDSLPKSLYLIIVAMTIIVTIPILITRYIKKAKSEPKEEVKVEPKKEEVKEEVKPSTDTKEENKFCSECGSKLLPNSAFCSECGHKIK